MNKKHEVITFKVEESLLRMMQGISNRSEFIRLAILSALDNVCPLCGGTGALTPGRKEHWSKFSRDHTMKKCGDCHDMTIVCQKQKAA